MLGVVLTEKERMENIEEFSKMEGVKWEGLSVSCHALAGNEHESIPMQKAGGKAGKGK